MNDGPGVKTETQVGDDGGPSRTNRSVVRMLVAILVGSCIGGGLSWAAVEVTAVSLGTTVGVGLGVAVGGGLGAVVSLLWDPIADDESVETIAVSMDETAGEPAAEAESAVPSRSEGGGDFFESHPNPALYFEGEESDLRVGDANAAFEATFGASASMLAGTPLDEATMTTDRSVVVSHIAAGESVTETVTCETVSGTDRFRLQTVSTDDSSGYLCYTPVRETADEGTDDRIEELASVVSHELNNPLDSARAHIDVARDTGDEEHFETAIRNLDRMTCIIDDLTTLAREGTVEETEAIDLDETVEIAWSYVDSPDATLTVVDDLGTVQADGSALERLVENLFRNAVEHGSTNSPSQAQQDAVEHTNGGIEITVGPLDDGFFVADDGPGIPEAEREKVFDAGYTTDPEGTGLGLRIVERVASAHGWTVSVSDSEAGGTRITVEGVDRSP